MQVFNLTREGNMQNFLGISFAMKNQTISMTQEKLIRQIQHDLGFNAHTKPKDTPAPIGQTLQKDENEPTPESNFHYASVIGKLNYLEKSTWPDIAFAVHNAARHSANPRQSHIKQCNV